MSGKVRSPLGAWLALPSEDHRAFRYMLKERSIPRRIFADLFLLMWQDVDDEDAHLCITHRDPARLQPAAYLLPCSTKTTRPTREQLEFIADDLTARLLLMGTTEKDQS